MNDETAPRLARDQLKSFVSRIENIETEVKELNSDKSDIYKEAKSQGFDMPALRAVVAYRRKDADDAANELAIFETYLAIVGTKNATRAHEETKSSDGSVEGHAADEGAARSVGKQRPGPESNPAEMRREGCTSGAAASVRYGAGIEPGPSEAIPPVRPALVFVAPVASPVLEMDDIPPFLRRTA